MSRCHPLQGALHACHNERERERKRKSDGKNYRSITSYLLLGPVALSTPSRTIPISERCRTAGKPPVENAAAAVPPFDGTLPKRPFPIPPVPIRIFMGTGAVTCRSVTLDITPGASSTIPPVGAASCGGGAAAATAAAEKAWSFSFVFSKDTFFRGCCLNSADPDAALPPRPSSPWPPDGGLILVPAVVPVGRETGASGHLTIPSVVTEGVVLSALVPAAPVVVEGALLVLIVGGWRKLICSEGARGRGGERGARVTLLHSLSNKSTAQGVQAIRCTSETPVNTGG